MFPASLLAPIKCPVSDFTAITTDSRAVTPGSLFVAISGDRVDGHDYIDQALAAGAAAVLCRKETPHQQPQLETQRLLLVDDPIQTYRKIAGSWRMNFQIPVVLIAGSAGKTTTKEFTAALLGGKYSKILKTQASQNGFLGIAMTLLDLRSDHQVAVIEVGIDEVGAMEQHLPLVQATHAVLTSIGPEHLEKLIDVPTVAREEILALVDTWNRGGSIVINEDDSWIQATLGHAVVPYPTGPRVRRISSSQQLPAGIECPLPGEHNHRNLLCALAVSDLLGIATTQAARGLTQFQNAEGRSVIKQLPDGGQIICDYYNSQPLSVNAAITVLCERTASLKKAGKTPLAIACLADMLELGPRELEYHAQLAEPLLAARVDHVLLLGKRMKSLEAALRGKNFAGQLCHFETHAQLSTHFLDIYKKSVSLNQTVIALIKGSRSMTMEKVWKELETALGPST